MYSLTDLDMKELTDPSSWRKATAGLIRKEAAESLLKIIPNNLFPALRIVLNLYDTHWWLAHLEHLGADPVQFWHTKLWGDIITVAKTTK